MKTKYRRTSFIKNRLHAIFIGVILLVLFVSHLLYILKTSQFPQEDEHSYLSLALQIRDNLQSPSFQSVHQILSLQTYRQLLYPFILSFPLLIFGMGIAYKLLLFVNIFFYGGTVIVIYLLAKQFVTKTSSLLAALLFAFYSFPLFYLHFLYSETATTFFVVLSLYFLAASIGFKDTKKTIFFSLSFAAGTLVRWVTPLFILGPFFVSVIELLLKKVEKKEILKRVGIVIIFSLVPMLALYYIPKWSYFIEYLKSNISHSPIWVSQVSHLTPEFKNTFSIPSTMFYIDIISQQTIFFFLIFCVGFFVCIRFWRKYLFFLLAFSIPFIFFTFGSVFKLDRFIVPLYPMVAIISSVTFDYIQNKKVKAVVILLSVIFSVLNFFASSWALGPMGAQGLVSITLPNVINYPVRIYLTPLVWPPREEITNARLIINNILDERTNSNEKTIVLATFSVYDIENGITSISSYEQRDELEIIFLRNLTKDNFSELFERIENADVVLIKDVLPIDSYRYSKEVEVFMFEVFNEFYSGKNFTLPGFEKVGQVDVPLDSSIILIFKKTDKFSPESIEEIGQAMEQSFPEHLGEIEKGIEGWKKL